MKVSIQRQCDGDYDAQDVHRCAAVLEVTFDIKDKATSEDWTKAWAAAGVVIGWRRLGPVGVDLQLGGPRIETTFIVPQTKTWIMCGEHSAKYVCAQCHEHTCSCVGGPLFDVIDPPEKAA